MRTRFVPLLLTALGCTPPASSDDDGNVTTAMSDANDEADASSSTSGTGTTASETSTASESEASSETASESSESFVPRAEWGPEFCDSFNQVCLEGEKCVPFADDGGELANANKCVPVLGDKQAGEPCTTSGPNVATDDCDATSYCLAEPGSDVGVCVAFCTGSPREAACEPGFTCLIGFEGAVAACLPQCHPQYGSTCMGGCYWTGAAFECLDVPGELAAGEPCELAGDCAPGHLCSEASALPSCAGPSCCTPFCLLYELVCTLPGTECVAMFEPGSAPLGHADLGVCVIPG